MRWAPGAGLLVLCLHLGVAQAAHDAVENRTRLPLYPNLSRAQADPAARTDALGRWCTRLAAQTAYPLAVVQAWYRRVLPAASETDLVNDEQYRGFADLTGSKFALGIDYVTVFRSAGLATTSIELFKCSP